MIKHYRNRPAARQTAGLEHVHIWRNRGDSLFARTVIHPGCWSRGPAIMAKPLDHDLRIRIIAGVDDGMSCRAAARRFHVSPSAVIKLMARYRATGSAKPGQMGGHRPRSLEGEREWVLARIPGKPTSRRARLRTNWPSGGSSSVTSRSGTCSGGKNRAIKKTLAASEQNRPDIRAGAGSGASVRQRLIRDGWFSSMKHGRKPTWRHSGDGARVA